MLTLSILASLPALAAPALTYEIDLVVDYDSGGFEGETTVHYSNSTGLPLTELLFRLYANDPSLYGSAFVQVTDVTVQTASVAFSLFLEDTVLIVPLTQPLAPNESIELALSFEGQASIWPAQSRFGTSQTGYGILTKSEDALTLTTFYPMLAVYAEEGWALDPSTGFGDALMGDSANYEVRVTARPGPVPVTSGVLTAVDPRTDVTVYSFAAANARDFSLVFVEDRLSVTSSANGTTINTWFSDVHSDAGDLANEMARFSLELFEEIVGPSPFAEIDLVEVPLQTAAGVEFSGLILVGSQYAATPSDIFYAVIISHEMAHQWFFAGVGNDVSEHPWLDESFATYLSYEFLVAYDSPETADRQLESWRSTYENARQRRPDLSPSSPKYAFPDSSTYSAFTYSGGAVFLDALRNELGDDAFYDFLQAYYAAKLYQLATSQDFIEIVEQSCNCSIGELLSTYRIVP